MTTHNRCTLVGREQGIGVGRILAQLMSSARLVAVMHISLSDNLVQIYYHSHAQRFLEDGSQFDIEA
jgi:hypothetical protein